MVVASGSGIPIGALVANANIFESKLTEQTVDTIRVPRAARGRPRTKPKRRIADKAYDSDSLRENFRRRGIDFITPDRPRRNLSHQDGRKLRRYKRRWKIERVFSWLDSWKRLAMRWDRSLTTYSGLFHIAIMVIALRRL